MPLGIFNGQALYLGVAVDSDPEMTPRLRMATVPYAIAANFSPPCIYTVCLANCVNTAVDVNNCGGCGIVCSVPNATPACVNGTCAIGNCNAGWRNWGDVPGFTRFY